jgi:hypothetical protein
MSLSTLWPGVCKPRRDQVAQAAIEANRVKSDWAYEQGDDGSTGRCGDPKVVCWTNSVTRKRHR